MTEVLLEITMSLDGFVAGPDASLEDPLGIGGMALHEWALRLAAWRSQHGLEGGEDGPDGDLMRATVARSGSVVMGRRMFSGGAGPWEDDPNAGGWWGDEPPFHVPVFVVTHHAREPLSLSDTTFTFVDGVEAAVEQARAAAGERDVHISGGADVAQQCLRAGLVDELLLHVAPVLLGSGRQLFDGTGALPLADAQVTSSPYAAHVAGRIVRH
jgi:dihydrofolate reductase